MEINLDEVKRMFEPDTLLPAQFYDENRRKTLDPEKQLMLAVLKDDITCFQKYLFAKNKIDRVLFREAEEWIVTPDSNWPFSFNNICEALGIDPQYLRQGLARWKEARLAGKAFRPKHAHRYNGSGRRRIK